MRKWNSHRPAAGRNMRWRWRFAIWLIRGEPWRTPEDEPAAAKATPAAEPDSRWARRLFSSCRACRSSIKARAISAADHLTFMVERSEAGRLLLVSRDQKSRGWVYEDEVVPLEQATDYLSQVVVNDIRDAESFWVLGRLWFYLNDARTALVNLNRAIRLPGSRPAFYLSRSLVHMRMKNIQRRAIGLPNDCETSIRLEPDRAAGRLVREQGRARQEGIMPGAMAALEEAFRLDPVNPFPRGPAPDTSVLGQDAAILDDDDLFPEKKAAGTRPEPHSAAEWVASGEDWVARAGI